MEKEESELLRVEEEKEKGMSRRKGREEREEGKEKRVRGKKRVRKRM